MCITFKPLFFKNKRNNSISATRMQNQMLTCPYPLWELLAETNIEDSIFKVLLGHANMPYNMNSMHPAFPNLIKWHCDELDWTSPLWESGSRFEEFRKTVKQV